MEEPQPLPEPKPLPYAAVLTVVDNTYFTPLDGLDPSQTDSRFEVHVKSEEQPYKRRLKIGEAWQRLESGWVKDAAMLVLANDEGIANLQLVPTEEQAKEIEGKILEVCDLTPLTTVPYGQWLVHPGQSHRGCPADLGRLFVRSRSGITRASLTIYPR